MIREFINLNVDIVSYAAKKCALYFSYLDDEKNTIIREVKTKNSFVKTFSAFENDLKSLLAKDDVKEKEINYIVSLFKAQFKKNIYDDSFSFNRNVPFPASVDPGYESLRENKLNEVLNELFYNLTNYGIRTDSTSPIVGYTFDKAKIEENANLLIDQHVIEIKKIFGIIKQ